MASLPARQQSQRRPTPPGQDNAPNQQSQPSHSPVRTRSEDSQTLFLNKPDSPEQQAATQQLPAASSNTAEDASVKKCWICFSDSTEDTPETSAWRSPCPCALVAHEECLLDWIADMESPTNTRTNNNHIGSSIQCPQCKSEIQLARPHNLVVEAVRRMEKFGADLVYPGAATVLFGTVYNASMAWGIHSIYAVFGADDGFRILRPLILNNVRRPIEFDNIIVRDLRDLRTHMLALVVDHIVHWRLYIGIPLITPMVVLSRTTFIDSILPVLPILFFATQTPSGNDPLNFGTWPPSAGLAFSILPYLRTAYNTYYRRVWLPREKQWLKEIQPRARSELNENDPGNPAVMPDNMDPDEEPLLEVRLDAGWEGDWDSDAEDEGEQGPGDEQDGVVEQEAQEVAIPVAIAEGDEAGQNDAGPEAIPIPDVPPRDQNANAQPNEQPAAAAGAGAQVPANNDRGERMRVSLTPIAETILGALLFPTLAGLSGELLKLALPRAWTTAPILPTRGGRVAAKGLLQEKWGRSLVGGCLFVVLKDAVMLYVRWKMAEMHRKRRVLDWVGKKNGTGVKT